MASTNTFSSIACGIQVFLKFYLDFLLTHSTYFLVKKKTTVAVTRSIVRHSKKKK